MSRHRPLLDVPVSTRRLLREESQTCSPEHSNPSLAFSFPFMIAPCYLWPQEVHPARPCEHLTETILSVTCHVLSTTVYSRASYPTQRESTSRSASTMSCVTPYKGGQHMVMSGAWTRSSSLSSRSRVSPFDKTEFRLLQGCHMLCLRRQAVPLSTRSWHTRFWASHPDL